jgi:hypothetical protein
MDLIHVYTFESMHRRRIAEPEQLRHLTHLHAMRQEARRERRGRMWRLLRPRLRPSGVAAWGPGHPGETTGGYV